MNSPDIERFRASLIAERQPDRLAARVVQSLGGQPRRIPSRTALAIERLTPRVIFAAALVSGIAIAAGLAARHEDADRSTSIVAGAMAGRPAPASEVFAAMTGLDARTGRAQ
jgi:hypothetical protein